MSGLGITKVIALNGAVQIQAVDDRGDEYWMSLSPVEAGMMITQLQAARRAVLGQTMSAEPGREALLPVREVEFLEGGQGLQLMRVHITSDHYQDFGAPSSSDLGDFLGAMRLFWVSQKRQKGLRGPLEP